MRIRKMTMLCNCMVSGEMARKGQVIEVSENDYIYLKGKKRAIPYPAKEDEDNPRDRKRK